jgi:hypothetical protein
MPDASILRLGIFENGEYVRTMKVSLLIAALVLATIGAGTAQAATTAPRLTVSTRTPLAVHGAGFEPRERVVVTAMTLSGARRAVVIATAAGRFTVTFRTANQPCGHAFAVRAAGGQGTVALMRLGAVPCVPPPRG